MNAPGFWQHIGAGLDVTAALALVSLAIWLWPRRIRFDGYGAAVVAAILLTALWCLAVAAFGTRVDTDLPSMTETARNLAWFFVVYRMFCDDGRQQSVAPVRPVVFALAFVEVLHLLLDLGTARLPIDPVTARIAYDTAVMLRLLVTVGGLVLVHNLYVGAPRETRSSLRWPAVGLAILWAFELNLYTIAYLAGHWPAEIAALRGLASLCLAACFAIAGVKDAEEIRIRPSRAVTFQTFSLLVIGVYLVAMVAIAQWLSYAGGNFARLVELTFLTLAGGVALVVLPSARMRGWLRVMTAKHFFQHRYDYREEWLRFTQTIGNHRTAELPLAQRVIQASADVFDSPSGLLLVPSERGDLTLSARWNWNDAEVPALAWPAQQLGFFEQTNFIADIDQIRSGVDLSRGQCAVPVWLIDEPRGWAAIPLLHYDRLVGMVVLARPAMARPFDWEDFDLLRVIGQQLAAFLAENDSQEALAESSRFEDFHRRIAFVMHDIKNLASQLSLLARNAELHAEKKEFRDDMLVTLRNSSEKLNALIARLSRYGGSAVEKLEPVQAEAVVASVLARFSGAGQVFVAETQPLLVTANAHSLEQVLVHLVQNAIDASMPGEPVCLSLTVEGLGARIEVLDSGCGMSADFVHSRLFKPFVSTKTGGFGIGAFEARELVRAMRGRLDVESREGLGSRFVITLPLVAGEFQSGQSSHENTQSQRVA